MPDTPPPRALVVTADPQLLDDLLRLAAVAGVEVDVATEASLARAGWAHAPLVLVGDELANPLAQVGLARRAGVVLVSANLDDADVWQRGVRLGADAVMFLPDAESQLVSRLADSVGGCVREATVLAVIGARGGAGATTLAAGLALNGARRARRTVLVDADPLGGGIDLVLGGEEDAGLRWPDLAEATGRFSGVSLTGALPTTGDLSVLSWDRGSLLGVPAAAVDAVLGAASRTAELVVVDLPRHLDPCMHAVLARTTATLLLVPAEVRATASAARVATALAPHAADLRLVVRGPAPSGLSAHTIAEALGLPLLAQMKPEPGIAAALERGEPPTRKGRGPLARLCDRVLDELDPQSVADADEAAA